MTLVIFNLSLLFELSAITDLSIFVEPGPGARLSAYGGDGGKCPRLTQSNSHVVWLLFFCHSQSGILREKGNVIR